MERLFLALSLSICMGVVAAVDGEEKPQASAVALPVAFAQGGKFKMLYDCRQRPQSVLLRGRLFIVYNGEWNSCYLARDAKNTLHAYVVVGEGYLEGGYMDRHGGGRIEEWVSNDKGNRWERRREISPTSQQYAGWRFNNIQPVTGADGGTVDGMLLFYGWKDENAPEAVAFLLHEANR